MRLDRRVRKLLIVFIVAAAMVATLVTPANAGLTPRNCSDIPTGDGLRMLSVCSRGYVDGRASFRAVVEMHTYAWGPCHDWVDSKSQSITMNSSGIRDPNDDTYLDWWGQDESHKCRVNGPAGMVACSVPNVTRVAFYGPQELASGKFQNEVWKVSWRDDRGIAHTTSGPWSPPWSA
jgi:hypothetical protein